MSSLGSKCSRYNLMITGLLRKAMEKLLGKRNC